LSVRQRFESDISGNPAYCPGFIDGSAADRLLRCLRQEVPWQSETFSLYGRTHRVPRRVAWFGDAGLNYRYTGSDHFCSGWHPALEELRQEILGRCGVNTNLVLLNRYQDGRDSMGWHTDAERGHAPLVASLSLGGTRRFLIRPVAGQPSQRWDLEHGSLLLLDGRQPHALPKTRRPVAERINLTFRLLEPS
jgi:alkylated DNA repair dioxygenase AlkB